MKTLFFCSFILFAVNSVLCDDKVLLSSVSTLTLHEGKFTTGKRTAPVPQLRCVVGTAPCMSLPSVVQCYNKGSDGMSTQWRCEAQMSKSVTFDQIQVSCEGYSHPSDPYILAGSCGLTYSLRPTGHRPRHRHQGWHHQHRQRFHQVPTVSPMATALSGLLVFLVVIALLALVFKLFSSRRHRYHRVYSAEAPPPPGMAPAPPAYGYHHPEGGSSGPGFWTGAAMGGMAGYMVGGMAAGPHHYYGHAAPPCDVVYESDYGVGGEDDIGSAVGFGSTWER